MIMRALPLLLLATACATAPAPEDVAWQQVTRVTESDYLGNDRVKIEIRKPLLLGVEGMEYALLTRAAAEAIERDAPSFAIVKVTYHQRLDALSPELVSVRRPWIGSYEELVSERERQTADFGGITGLEAIVLLAPQDKLMLRESFDAEDTFDALTDVWIDQYNIQ